MASPLDELLKSRGGQQGTFTSQLNPNPLPMDPFSSVKAGSQLSGFYERLNSIAQKTEEQKNQAEDQIYRQIQKKKEEALIKKIKAMMPQPVAPPSGGFNLPNYNPPRRNGSGLDGNSGLNLPKVGPPKGGGNLFPPIDKPKVAPPSNTFWCPPWLHAVGLC